MACVAETRQRGRGEITEDDNLDRRGCRIQGHTHTKTHTPIRKETGKASLF